MHRSSRSVLVAASLVGPLLLLASTVAYIAGGDGMSEGEAAGAIQVWAFVAVALALVGCARALETRTPVGATVLSVTAIVGCVGGALYGLDAIQLAVLDGSIHEHAASPFALRIPGLFFPVALLVLGVLVARRARAPRVAVVATVLGAVLFPAGRIGDVAAIAVVTDLLILVGLAMSVRALPAEPAQASAKPV